MGAVSDSKRRSIEASRTRSAASRAYIPESLWKVCRDPLCEQADSITYGDVCDFTNFMGAVIDRRTFGKISGYIDRARRDATIVAGCRCDDSHGFFINLLIGM